MHSPSFRPREVFSYLKTELENLSHIGPDTKVEKDSAGHFTGLVTGSTNEKTAKDIKEFSKKYIEEINQTLDSISKAKDPDKKRKLGNEIIELNNALKKAMRGRPKGSGISSIIQTYSSIEKVSKTINKAFDKMNQSAEEAVIFARSILSKLNGTEDILFESSSVIPEEHYTDENWEREILASHDLQSETINIFKYFKYDLSLKVNMALNAISLNKKDVMEYLYGEEFKAEWDWWNTVGHYENADLYLGALPLSMALGRNDLEAIKEAGVKAILSVVEVFESKTPGYIINPITSKEWENASVKQLQLPTPDFETISLEEIERGVEFIHWNLKNDRSTYVHCKAGRGRSALIVMCYLMKYQNMSAIEAFDAVRKSRPQAGFTEKSDKFKTLLEFEKKYPKKMV